MSVNFSYILYLEILAFGVLIAVTLPFVLEDIDNKRKSKRLVKLIASNDNYSVYDISLIETLAKSKQISLKYMKYIFNQLVMRSHDTNEFEKMSYFINLNKGYLLDEKYNKLPSKISHSIESLRQKLGGTDETLISNLTYHIQELVDESNFRRKLSQSLTIASIIVGILSLVVPFFNFI